MVFLLLRTSEDLAFLYPCLSDSLLLHVVIFDIKEIFCSVLYQGCKGGGTKGGGRVEKGEGSGEKGGGIKGEGRKRGGEREKGGREEGEREKKGREKEIPCTTTPPNTRLVEIDMPVTVWDLIEIE